MDNWPSRSARRSLPIAVWWLARPGEAPSIHLALQHPTASGAARFPIVWAPVAVRNSQDTGSCARHVVPDRVGKSRQHAEVNTVLIGRPHVGTDSQTVSRFKDERTERVRRNCAALKVPEESLAKLLLSLGQDLNDEAAHSAPRRARTSDQGCATARLERRSALRFRSSSRHASETAASSPLSRLSMSAAATAERSSAERPSTSSSSWSTRAFMRSSLAAGCAKPLLAPSASPRNRPPAPARRVPHWTASAPAPRRAQARRWQEHPRPR